MRFETYIPSWKRAKSMTTKKFMPWAIPADLAKREDHGHAGVLSSPVGKFTRRQVLKNKEI